MKLLLTLMLLVSWSALAGDMCVPGKCSGAVIAQIRHTSLAVDQFMPPNAADENAAESGMDYVRWPYRGTLSRLVTEIQVVAGAGDSWTSSLRLNSAATALSCQITGTSALVCEDSANSVVIDPTDEAHFLMDANGPPTAHGGHGISALFVPAHSWRP